MQTIEQLLAEAPAFDGMAQDQLALIAGCAQNKVFEDGEYLMREGDAGGQLLRHPHGPGRARDLRPAARAVTIETIDDGGLVGWSWLVPPFRVHLDARALGPVHVDRLRCGLPAGQGRRGPCPGLRADAALHPGDRRAAPGDPCTDARRLRTRRAAEPMPADPMLPSAYVVTDKRQELGDTWTLELEPASGEGVGEFRPGQFSMLYAFGAGEVPISVSASDGGSLVHTVRAVGAATRAICSCEPGDQLGVRGPFGSTWPLEEAEGGDVVVVTGGIGLAPLRPAIEHLIAKRDSYGAVAVLYGARSPDEMLFFGELERWREAGIDVEVHGRHCAPASGTGGSGW